MMAVFYYLLKVTLCAGILFLYYQLALRNKKFHQWNRFYLLFAVLASIFLPLLQVTLSLGTSNANGAIQLVKTVQSADEFLEEIVVVGRHSPSPEQWMIFFYGTVSVILFAGFLLSIRKIYQVIHSHTVTVLDKIKFVNTTAEGTPFSFLNYIVWNQNISLQSSTGRQIFQHELIHVEEKHTLDKLLMEVVLVLFWCNPFFWLIRKELRFIHEFIADEKAVAEHGTAAFAAMILQSAYPQQFASLTNPFFQTPIKRRLAMLTKLQNPKLNYFSRLIALPVIALTVFAFTLRVNSVPSAILSRDFVVVIDAGHGKTATGNYSGAHGEELYEDQVVLAISKKIRELNSNSRIKIILSRPSDESTGLKERVAVAATEHADLFLSLHMNAAEGAGSVARTTGVEVFLASKPTPYQQQSEIAGSALQQQLKTVYTTYPLLLQANAWVLNQNVCPSALIGIGYVTNEKDRRFFSSEANQKLVAEKILTAINQYASGGQQQTSLTRIQDTVPPNGKKLVAVDVKKEENKITLHYEDGSKETLTREQAIERKLIKENVKKQPTATKQPEEIQPAPLYIVDEEEYRGNINDIPPSTIEKINVLKGETALAKYGDKGKNGVVEITRKKTAGDQEKQDAVVFEKAEVSASIDQQDWRQFLEENLGPVVSAVSKKAPSGKYTVNVRFIVNKDGSLSDFQVLNDPGYSIAENVLALMKQAPKWKPAVQNGHLVRSYHTQPLTLVITEGKSNS